ncbi:MAG TPA: MBL fold metallo-hydrolase [Verrucomicrobiae bacterium]|nr:MBL fold metallo-hydrolase [Verrucomicrobiae bacterium]
MTLEDHVGDIIRKARQAANVSKEAAASAAGLMPAQLDELEESGRTVKQPDLAKLAPVVGLNGPKLQRIAKGWLPNGTDLSLWRELRQITTTQRLSVNCYLVWDEVTREAALFDTGWDARPIFQFIDENQLQLKHLFITHTHEDHIAALGPLRERFPKIRLHSGSKSAPPDQRNRPNDFIHLGSLRITNRETPGHAEDGVTYIVGNFPEDASNAAIVGDCIFAGSIGRGFVSTDLLKQKIREQIFTLPPDTLICPGHGPFTTVKQEIDNNPFF